MRINLFQLKQRMKRVCSILSDFLVSDINGAYTYVEDWDIKASFEEKAGKYGMVKTPKGYAA